jgi:cell division protein FtsQ
LTSYFKDRPVVPSADERPEQYRRRRAVVPHRRQRLFVRLLRPMLTALALVGIPAAVTYWAATTPYLHIQQVEVAGTERVSAAWVRQALATLEGRHLLHVGLGDVERRLAAHDWIRHVAVRKELPDRLYVEIEERQPAALLRLRGELFYVERDAHVIAACDRTEPDEGLLILDAPTGSEIEVAPALDLAAEWRRLDPSWSGELSEIEIVSEEDFRVHADDLAFPVFVSPGSLERGLERLSWLLPQIDRRYPAVASVDIRFSRQIVIEPAAVPQTEEG